METKRFFFILGMPRTRTAWLSVLLTCGGTLCLHEGTDGHESMSSYAAALRACDQPCVGDANPSLAFHLPFLLREFPDARFLFVRRPAAESLESLCREQPEKADAIRAGWNEYLAAFEYAFTRIKNRVSLEAHELADFDKCSEAVEFLTGDRICRQRFERLSKLRISSRFPEIKAMPPVSRAKISAVISHDGFDFSGLSLSAYNDSADRQMICGWFAGHKYRPMPEIGLPPLGVVVSDENGPCAALWCFETYGTGVAWIEFPVTRPGLSLKQAESAIAFAILGVIQVAGKSYEPPAEFRRFRACCPPSMARVLKRLGFVESEQRSNLLLTT